MANGKVQLSDGTVLIDLTGDTVDAASLLLGKIAHGSDGELITGTHECSGGEGIPNCDLLFSNDSLAITYTSTNAGTAATLTVPNLYNYPMVVVVFEKKNTSSSLSFLRSTTVLMNTYPITGSTSVTRYGAMQYMNSSGAVTNSSSTSYGLWGHSIGNNKNTSLTVRGRCNSSYFSSLSGQYHVRVIGIKF